MRTRLIVGIGAVVIAGALPSVAGATDYCVGLNTACDALNHRATLQQALDAAAAAPNADRILLGAEPYTAPTAAGFSYQAQNSPVQIIGQGVGQTTLTGPAGAHGIVYLFGGAGSSVSDLTIDGPQNVAGGYAGLFTQNTARRIKVMDDPTQSNFISTGVYLEGGGTLEDSTVTLHGWGVTGVFLAGGHVRRSSLTAETGAKANNGSIEQSRIYGYDTGVMAYGGTTSIVSSRISAGETYGILAASYAGVPRTTVSADSVTIVGTGGAGTGAAATTEYDTAFSAELHLTNSIVRGFPHALEATAPASGEAKVTTSYSDYDPSANSKSGLHASIAAANVLNVGNAGFVDAAGGDYHLLRGSPLVDAGAPATPQALDLDGKALVTDGNGDGSARRDVGAFELPAAPGGDKPVPDTQAPLITGFRATPALFRIGRASTAVAASTPRGTRFRYTLSEQARVTFKIQRRLAGHPARYRRVGRLTRSGRAGVNRTRFSGRLGKRALRPGRYRVRITAIDAAGNRSARRIARFRITRR